MSNAPRGQFTKQWGDDDSGVNILHIDLDSFFAAAEVVADPSLRGKMLVVGGKGRRGVVTSATYDARALGVRAGMPIGKARSLAPNALFLPGNSGLYRDLSAQVMQLISTVSPTVEQVSIDEAYVDVSGSKRRLGSAVEIAQMIRASIREQVGLPASVGMGRSKLIAKIASSHAKPDGVLLIPEAATLRFLHQLPVGAIPGVGGRTQQILHRLGIETVEQLSGTDPQWLAKHLGEQHALRLVQVASGNESSSLRSREVEKSISTEQTFEVNLTSRSEIESFLVSASHDCALRLRKAALVTHTVQIKLRDGDFRTITRAQTLSAPTDLGRQIASTALSIFSKCQVPVGGVRLVGVGVHGLAEKAGGFQVALDYDGRPAAAEEAMDAVKGKFGKQSIQPASALRPQRGS